jgi:hypothetical protein
VKENEPSARVHCAANEGRLRAVYRDRAQVELADGTRARVSGLSSSLLAAASYFTSLVLPQFHLHASLHPMVSCR